MEFIRVIRGTILATLIFGKNLETTDSSLQIMMIMDGKLARMVRDLMVHHITSKVRAYKDFKHT